jgi:hypothetical protein
MRYPDSWTRQGTRRCTSTAVSFPVVSITLQTVPFGRESAIPRGSLPHCRGRSLFPVPRRWKPGRYPRLIPDQGTRRMLPGSRRAGQCLRAGPHRPSGCHCRTPPFLSSPRCPRPRCSRPRCCRRRSGPTCTYTHDRHWPDNAVCAYCGRCAVSGADRASGGPPRLSWSGSRRWLRLRPFLFAGVPGRPFNVSGPRSAGPA